MADTKQERFPDYPIFKGLQRPLEFFGLQGRYIYWAAGDGVDYLLKIFRRNFACPAKKPYLCAQL
jgi:hypothetical protein